MATRKLDGIGLERFPLGSNSTFWIQHSCQNGSAPGNVMAVLKLGDRVELVGDISRYYPAKVGTITAIPSDRFSVLKEFVVTLADGKSGTFFDFQLQIPPAVIAHPIFDSSTMQAGTELRGEIQRKIRFVSSLLDIDFQVLEVSGNRCITGELWGNGRLPEYALVSMVLNQEPVKTTVIDATGHFNIELVPAGPVTIEVLMPSVRVMASFTA